MKNTMLIVCLLLVSAVAAANQHTEMKPDPALRQLDPFAGRLRCSGTAFASPMSPQHATTGEVNAKWDLGGYWLPFTYAEKKGAANPMPFTVSGFFGYDAEGKKLLMGSVDNMGGYSTESASGWDGDTIVFVGPWHMSGQTVNARDTFRKIGNKQLWHRAEIEQDGNWVTLGEETCTRK